MNNSKKYCNSHYNKYMKTLLIFIILRNVRKITEPLRSKPKTPQLIQPNQNHTHNSQVAVSKLKMHLEFLQTKTDKRIKAILYMLLMMNCHYKIIRLLISDIIFV